MTKAKQGPAPDIYADEVPDTRSCRGCLYMLKDGKGGICCREAGMRHPVEGWERCDFWKEGDRAVPGGGA